MLYGCSSGDEASNAQPGEVAQKLTFAVASSALVNERVRATGRVVPREVVSVASPAEGDRLIQILVDEGEVVQIGQIVARLDPTYAKIALEKSRSQMASAHLRMQSASKDLSRSSGLDEPGLLSGEDQAHREDAHALAAKSLSDAQLDVSTAAHRLSDRTLRAPASGIVIQRLGRVGDVNQAAQPVITIARNGMMEIDAVASSSIVRRLRQGTQAEITLDSGERVTGTVRLISPQVDPRNGLAHVRITLPGNLRSSAFGLAQVEFLLPVSARLAVPAQAIIQGTDGTFVSLIDKNNRLKTVRVHTGATGGGVTEIRDGILAGARVVVAGEGLALDGDKVVPVPMKSTRNAK